MSLSVTRLATLHLLYESAPSLGQLMNHRIPWGLKILTNALLWPPFPVASEHLPLRAAASIQCCSEGIQCKLP